MINISRRGPSPDVHGRLHIVRLLFCDDRTDSIAPVRSDFCCETNSLCLMGLAGWRLDHTHSWCLVREQRRLLDFSWSPESTANSTNQRISQQDRTSIDIPVLSPQQPAAKQQPHHSQHHKSRSLPHEIPRSRPSSRCLSRVRPPSKEKRCGCAGKNHRRHKTECPSIGNPREQTPKYADRHRGYDNAENQRQDVSIHWSGNAISGIGKPLAIAEEAINPTKAPSGT